MSAPQPFNNNTFRADKFLEIKSIKWFAEQPHVRRPLEHCRRFVATMDWLPSRPRQRQSPGWRVGAARDTSCLQACRNLIQRGRLNKLRRRELIYHARQYPASQSHLARTIESQAANEWTPTQLEGRR